MKIYKKISINAEITVPSDKSISHRSIMCAALAEGTSRISNLLMSADVLATVEMMAALGVDVTIDGRITTVKGVGLKGLIPTNKILNAYNSGTTARIMSGILSGQNGVFSMDGDKYLRKRPMSRVRKPLTLMGAEFDSDVLPMTIRGGDLHGIDYVMETKSAQVKSAVIFAGLNAEGATTVTEIGATRNHTEKMLKSLGVDIAVDGLKITLVPPKKLSNFEAEIPCDISSAAFFMVLGLIVEGSIITIKNVGMNPTRNGIVEIIKLMGGDVEVSSYSDRLEPTADVTVRYTKHMHGIQIPEYLIPNIIDELPIISVLACFCEGTTIISKAEELRVKESDRIKAMTTNLNLMGGKVTETNDGMIIEGAALHSAKIDSFGDHRIAMSGAVALSTTGGEIVNGECVDISFPTFFETLGRM